MLASGYGKINSALQADAASGKPETLGMEALSIAEQRKLRRGRVRLLLDMLGQTELAERTGIAAAYLYQMGRASGAQARGVSDDNARLIEGRLGLPYGWLDAKTDPPSSLSNTAESGASHLSSPSLRPIRTWDSVEDLPADEYVVVPRMTLRFSAGDGGPIAEPDPQLDQGQAFRTAYIRRKRLKPRSLMSAYAQGDSMEPRICDSDALLIDTSQTDIQDGKVYAVVWTDNEELRVKRLYKLPGGGILIRSDNRDRYPEITVPADQVGTVTILGRVVLVSGDV